MSVVAIPPVRASLSESNISTLALLYEAAGAVNFTPGWIPRNKPVLWAEPRPQFLPAHWSYEDAKAGLDAAGRLIDVTLAERRNLIMRNPAPIAGFETSRTLVAAYQMILPGEHAPSHRHSSHALRVIIDGKGSYSIVDGEKTPMETGDVVLTPSRQRGRARQRRAGTEVLRGTSAKIPTGRARGANVALSLHARGHRAPSRRSVG